MKERWLGFRKEWHKASLVSRTSVISLLIAAAGFITHSYFSQKDIDEKSHIELENRKQEFLITIMEDDSDDLEREISEKLSYLKDVMYKLTLLKGSVLKISELCNDYKNNKINDNKLNNLMNKLQEERTNNMIEFLGTASIVYFMFGQEVYEFVTNVIEWNIKNKELCQLEPKERNYLDTIEHEIFIRITKQIDELKLNNDTKKDAKVKSIRILNNL